MCNRSKPFYTGKEDAAKVCIDVAATIYSSRSRLRGFLFHLSLRSYRPLPIPPPYMPRSTPAFLTFALPNEIGTYLCLYMCIICRFMVMKKSTKKYKSSIGQKTGISKMLKKVMKRLVTTPLVQANQNLNSGNRRANGRNSLPSRSVVGRPGPSSSLCIWEGSSNGLKKAMKLLSKKIPNPYATIKYPWTRYTRRKNSAMITVNPIHRGTVWIVLLSNQYWKARLTGTGRNPIFDKKKRWRST
jgi:hypothetical protein